jgi:hypothetical protein
MRPNNAVIPILFAMILAACATTEDPWNYDVGVDTAYDPGTDPGFDPGYDPGYDPGTDTIIDPGTDPVVDPGTDPVVDPITDPGTDPGCTETPCGLVPQCGCAVGQKCSLVGTTRQCVTSGFGTRGASCTADSDCAAGLICLLMFTQESASEGACYPFCNSETECPGDAAVCWEAFTGSTDKVCTLGCNLITSSGCPSGSKCMHLSIPTGQDITDCSADAGSGTLGSYCTLESQCGPGYFCGAASSVFECIGYCTLLPTDSCIYGCQQFVDGSGLPADIVFDGYSYGYCY